MWTLASARRYWSNVFCLHSYGNNRVAGALCCTWRSRPSFFSCFSNPSFKRSTRHVLLKSPTCHYFETLLGQRRALLHRHRMEIAGATELHNWRFSNRCSPFRVPRRADGTWSSSEEPKKRLGGDSTGSCWFILLLFWKGDELYVSNEQTIAVLLQSPRWDLRPVTVTVWGSN